MDELPTLSPEAIRVLGSLIEKSRTTPDYYPMSLNALTAACNQKSSRHPIVDYDESTVLTAINELKALSLVATAVGAGVRTVKYKHSVHTVLDVTDGGLAALCLLFLRGPLTPGEINSSSGRLHEFSSIESVIETLAQLSNSQPPLVTLLPKRPGQKEARYAHLFSGEPDMTDLPEPVREESNSTLITRVEQLEKEVAELREMLGRITRELL